jgi:glycerate kinase
MHVLIAPNAFKHSLGARQAAEAIGQGLKQSRLDATWELFPVGDGGDGTGELLADNDRGTRVRALVQNPLGFQVEASWWLMEEGRTALIEMAFASGLRLLGPGQPNPLEATSYGTGELMLRALDQGVEKIILTLGGSATVDGGTGILRALGLKLYDKNGVLIESPGKLYKLSRIDAAGLDPRLQKVQIDILCDVDYPLLGPQGGIQLFGPQKGAKPADIPVLEKGLSLWAKMSESAGLVAARAGAAPGSQSAGAAPGSQSAGAAPVHPDLGLMPFGGAAGGISLGLFAWLGARLLPGAEDFLEKTGFDQHLRKTHLVITAEGTLDKLTLGGKAPFAVAQHAKRWGIPIVVMAGRIPLEDVELLKKHFDILLPLANEPLSLEEALSKTEENLRRAARELGDMLALGHALS